MRGIRLALERLVVQGIVREQRTNVGVLYSLNDDHLAAPALRGLATLRATLLERISTELGRWQRPATYAALFGSAARGDMTAASDLDLFVVRPRNLDVDDDIWRQQLADLAQRVAAWTGNDARVLEYGEERVLAGDEPLLSDIAEDAVVLTGDVTWLRGALHGSYT